MRQVEDTMVQFAVTLKDAEWTVFKDGVPIESGMSRSRAVERAQALAFEAEESGEDVDLVIQGYTGELQERHSGGGRRQPPGRGDP
jgi:hypothetical protein